MESRGEALQIGQEFLGDLLEGLLLVVYTKEALQLGVCFWEGHFNVTPLEVPQNPQYSHTHTHSHC